ncbi:hypothetical protein BGW37DRAFT_554569 [Umbelopsis sp. PMI_123]|nr:hypothetical protein BGW37DRAFT_554569 [Umbelopsis sp. PMI_123]
MLQSAAKNDINSNMTKKARKSAGYTQPVSSKPASTANGISYVREHTTGSDFSESNLDELQSESSASSNSASMENVSTSSFEMMLVAAIQSTSTNNAKARAKALKLLYKTVTHYQTALPHVMDSFYKICSHRCHDTSILIRESVLSLLIDASLPTSLNMSTILEIALDRSKDVSSIVRKKSIRLLAKLFKCTKEPLSRVKILNAIILATSTHNQAVRENAIRSGKDILFGEDYYQMTIRERAGLLLLTAKSLHDDGYIEILDEFIVKCKEALISSPGKISPARDLIEHLLDRYICTDTDVDLDRPSYNILSVVICSLIKIHPDNIIIAYVGSMSSSVDRREEVDILHTDDIGDSKLEETIAVQVHSGGTEKNTT